MYRQERDLSPDHYDSVKIANVELMGKRKASMPFVDMKKQTKRDFSHLYAVSEFYRNVQRENDRADFIK